MMLEKKNVGAVFSVLCCFGIVLICISSRYTKLGTWDIVMVLGVSCCTAASSIPVYRVVEDISGCCASRCNKKTIINEPPQVPIPVCEKKPDDDHPIVVIIDKQMN